MNGLMLYRQFLENIRNSINNYDLNELEAKDYLSILSRVNEIEDLTYIDVILKNAGLDLSFISNNDFLHTPVELKSRLGEVMCKEEIFEEEIEDEMQEAFSEYLNNFVSSEDTIISKIEELLVEKGLEELDNTMLPNSGSKVLSTDELLEKNKDTLSALFSGLATLSKTMEEAKEETKDVDDSELEDDMEFEELEDIEDTEEIKEIEDTEDTEEIDDIDEKDKIEDIDFVEKEEKEELTVSEDKPKSKKLNTSFLDDDFEEEELLNVESSEDMENNDSDDYDDNFEDKEFSMFLEDDSFDESDLEDSSSEDSEFEDSSSEAFELEDDYEKIDNLDIEMDEPDIEEIIKGRDLDSEVSMMYSLNEVEDTDPKEGNPFREASEYFLNGGKKVKREKEDKENLKKLYKNKEKIVDIEGVNDFDDALAKFLLAVGDGVLNLPSNTSNLIQKLRKNGKKVYGNMVVEDDADEDE